MQYTERLISLLPVGTVLTKDRVIVGSNALFAELFEYDQTEILGRSLEMLYPSHRHFVERGEEWFGHFRSTGSHCDERIMLRRGDRPIRMRVNGRCEDRRNPYEYVACTFEQVPEVDGTIELSRREREIVGALGDGLTSKQIARLLNLSHRTVETYRSRLLIKTGARNTAQLLNLLQSND